MMILFAALSLGVGLLRPVDIDVPRLPRGESANADFSVLVAGTSVPVWDALTNKTQFGGHYGFASFDSDEPQVVEVRSARLDLGDARVLPLSKGIRSSFRAGRLQIHVPGPGFYTVRTQSPDRALHIFVNPKEREAPRRGEPGVVYYGPGIHSFPNNVLNLRDNQTLYLAPGAVVRGAIHIEGRRNVKILGRGILDGTPWPHLRGPSNQMIRIANSRNVTIDGITIRGSYGWTVLPYRSQDVTIQNVKIVNDRVMNDDGINPSNSTDVVIRNCFIRTDDDCIAMKGIRLYNHEDVHLAPTERVTIEDSQFWGSRARIVLLGHESEAERMKDIVFRDLDIIHSSMTPFLLEPGEDMTLQDVRIENVDVTSDGKTAVVVMRPIENEYMKYKRMPGRIDGVIIRNLKIRNPRSDGPLIVAEGKGSRHEVRNVDVRSLSVVGGRGIKQWVYVGYYGKNIKYDGRDVKPGFR